MTLESQVEFLANHLFAPLEDMIEEKFVTVVKYFGNEEDRRLCI
jgi:hypothetical protein